MKLIEFTGLDKRGGESYGRGDPVYVNPEQVAAVEGKRHHFHSFRPPDEYTLITLNTGQTVEVWEGAKQVRERLAQTE